MKISAANAIGILTAYVYDLFNRRENCVPKDTVRSVVFLRRDNLVKVSLRANFS